jgi:hypothetical protein
MCELHPPTKAEDTRSTNSGPFSNYADLRLSDYVVQYTKCSTHHSGSEETGRRRRAA